MGKTFRRTAKGKVRENTRRIEKQERAEQRDQGARAVLIEALLESMAADFARHSLRRA